MRRGGSACRPRDGGPLFAICLLILLYVAARFMLPGKIDSMRLSKCPSDTLISVEPRTQSNKCSVRPLNRSPDAEK